MCLCAGEINTLQGNLNWMSSRQHSLKNEVWHGREEELLPLCNAAESDSANLDHVAELLMRTGVDPCESLMVLVPEAYHNHPELRKNYPEVRGRQAGRFKFRVATFVSVGYWQCGTFPLAAHTCPACIAAPRSTHSVPARSAATCKPVLSGVVQHSLHCLQAACVLRRWRPFMSSTRACRRAGTALPCSCLPARARSAPAWTGQLPPRLCF